MNKLIKAATLCMLLFNGIGAFYGGSGLIMDPTGARIRLSQHFLEKTPFNNYLIPGIILLIVNGVFSFITVGTIILKYNRFYLFVAAQGILLTGWLLIQLMMIRTFYAPMHLPLLSIGILLILSGIYFFKIKE